MLSLKIGYGWLKKYRVQFKKCISAIDFILIYFTKVVKIKRFLYIVDGRLAMFSVDLPHCMLLQWHIQIW